MDFIPQLQRRHTAVGVQHYAYPISGKSVCRLGRTIEKHRRGMMIREKVIVIDFGG